MVWLLGVGLMLFSLIGGYALVWGGELLAEAWRGRMSAPRHKIRLQKKIVNKKITGAISEMERVASRYHATHPRGWR